MTPRTSTRGSPDDADCYIGSSIGRRRSCRRSGAGLIPLTNDRRPEPGRVVELRPPDLDPQWKRTGGAIWNGMRSTPSAPGWPTWRSKRCFASGVHGMRVRGSCRHDEYPRATHGAPQTVVIPPIGSRAIVDRLQQHGYRRYLASSRTPHRHHRTPGVPQLHQVRRIPSNLKRIRSTRRGPRGPGTGRRRRGRAGARPGAGHRPRIAARPAGSGCGTGSPREGCRDRAVRPPARRSR